MPCMSAQLERGGGVVGGEVHQHRSGERVARDVLDRLLGGGGAPAGSVGQPDALLLLRGERGEPPGGEPLRIEHEPRAVDDPGHLQVQRRPAHLAHHRGEAAPDLAEAEQDDLHALGLDHPAAGDARELEGRVDPPLRLGSLPGLDHDRDVELRASLGDGHDVDLRGGQRGEHRRRHARRAVHAEAHDRHRGHVEAELDAVDLAAADLAGELPLQALPRVGGQRLGHAEADRMLRGGLRDERHRDLPAHGARERSAPRCRARPACRCR